ncbi:hypothetical protein NONI108955_19960 [Nocardia ninae]
MDRDRAAAAPNRLLIVRPSILVGDTDGALM